jgi:probable HAF family extracellular repeat protein
MQNLSTLLGGVECTASCISNSGQVAGWAYTSPQSAFLYSGGSMQDLGTLPGGSYSVANGVNNGGQVAGNATTSSGDTHAFLYSGGTMTDIGTLGGTDSEANGINNSGQVVGWARTSGNAAAHAFLYNGGASPVLLDLGTLPGGFNSEAFGINNSGQVVGFVYMTDLGSAGAQDAFLYSDGLMQDLNSLIPLNSGWTLEDATGINDSGQICGYGINSSGQGDAFLLTPTPEPSTFALLTAGAIGLIGYGLRRRRVTRRTANPTAFYESESNDNAPATLSLPSHTLHQPRFARRAA